MSTPPSPVRAGARPASPPVWRGATHRTVILPRPLGGEVQGLGKTDIAHDPCLARSGERPAPRRFGDG